MTDRKLPDNLSGIQGSGGGGKGGGAPTEVKDNQFSTVIARVLTAYSSGTTGGLVNGENSVYLNETRLKTFDVGPIPGTYNFDGVTVAETDGTGFTTVSPISKPSKGSGGKAGPATNFTSVTSTVSVGTQLEQATPVIRTVSGTDVNAVRIIMTMAGLQNIEEDGDIKGTTVSLTYAVRDPASGIWEDRGTQIIRGKSSGPFQRAYRLAAPDTVTAAWDWRVTRNTADSSSARLSNDTTVQAAVELFYGTETYDDTAAIGLEFATEDFGNSLPSVAFEVSGVKVRVPSNYTITEGGAPEYTGIWDGTFKFESTSNPVWHLYHLLIDDEVGLGLDESFVDRYNFYEVARYNDAVDETGTFVGVDDGDGGVRRRFTFNTQINGQKDGIEMLQEIASSMRAILYFGAGAVVLKQDAPRSTARIVTNDNVKDGIFAYSSTSAKDRITVAKVAYNDPDDFFKVRYAIYPQQSDWATDANIARFGRNELEVAKMGCASEAEAEAFAHWIVYTSCNEDRTCTFIGGPEFLLTRPGDVLEIADRRLAGASSFDQRYGGRIAPGSTTTTVELDYPVDLPEIASYEITIIGADGVSLLTQPIGSFGENISSIVINGVFPEVPTTGYTWLIKGTDITPQKFSVINIERKEGLEVEIFAVKYDENKFGIVEATPTIIPRPYTKINVENPAPPTNMTFQQVPHNDPVKGILNKLIVKWEASPSELVTRYNVRYRRNNDSYVALPPTAINEVTLPDVIEGTYDFIVSAVNPLGYESTPLTGSYDVIYGTSFEWEGTTGVYQAPVVDNQTFETKDFDFVWTRAPGNNIPGFVFKDYKVELFSGATLERTEYVTQPSYTYYFDDMVNDQGVNIPNRNITINVTERDAYNNESATDGAVGSNPEPLAPVFSLDVSFDQVIVQIEPSSEGDIAGHYVFASLTSGFTPGVANQIYKGGDTSVVIPGLNPGDTYYVVVQAYDLFDDSIGSGALSAEQSATTGTLTLDAEITEYSFEDITFTKSGANIFWTAGTVVINTGTTVTTNAIAAGGPVGTGGPKQYIYYDPATNPNVLLGGTNLAAIYSSNPGVRVVATWDGVTLIDGTADPIIDGSSILAETVGATQVVTSGLITNTAQINDALISSAKIQDAAITEAKIGTAAITNAKIQDAAITEAKIGTAAITTAKIGTAQVDTLQVANGAITDISTFETFNLTFSNTYNGTIDDGWVQEASSTYVKGANDFFLHFDAVFGYGNIIPSFGTNPQVGEFIGLDMQLRVYLNDFNGSNTQVGVRFLRYDTLFTAYSAQIFAASNDTFSQGSNGISLGFSLDPFPTGQEVEIIAYSRKTRDNSTATVTQSDGTFTGNFTWWTR